MKAVFMALSAAALLAGPARAQLPGGLDGERVSAEARIGGSAGNYGGAASEFEVLPGAAWGASVSYEARERLAVYLGYDRAGFRCGTGFCTDREVHLASRGWDAGVRYALPVSPETGPWVSAGIVRRTLRVQADGVEGDDGSGWGFSAGAGAQVPVGRRLSVTPGIRYVRHGAGDDDVAVVVADVGLRIRMGESR